MTKTSANPPDLLGFLRKTAEVGLETERLEKLREQYLKEITASQAKLDQLQKKVTEASASVENAENNLRSLERKLPPTSESRVAVQKAKESLKSIRTTNTELSAQAERTSKTLGSIAQEIKLPSTYSTDIDLARFCRDKFGAAFAPLDTSHLYCTDGKTTTEVERAEVCRWAYGTEEVDIDFGSRTWSCKRH